MVFQIYVLLTVFSLHFPVEETTIVINTTTTTVLQYDARVRMTIAYDTLLQVLRVMVGTLFLSISRDSGATTTVCPFF